MCTYLCPSNSWGTVEEGSEWIGGILAEAKLLDPKIRNNETIVARSSTNGLERQRG
jgi:hypothetical protein